MTNWMPMWFNSTNPLPHGRGSGHNVNRKEPRTPASGRSSFLPRAIRKSVLAFVAVALAWAQSNDSLASLIEKGNRKAALDKIKAGADVNALQPDGTSPLHWAVYKVDYELIDALIAKKAKVDAVNEFGSSPLSEAVKLADARMVKTLLAAGAKPDTANSD